MKRFYSILAVIAILLAVSSCNEKNEIVGTWNNTATEISQLDEIAQARYESEVNALNAQKEELTAQLDTLTDSLKTAAEATLQDIENKLSSLSVDAIKDEIAQNYKKGSITFNEDNTVTVDSLSGSWTLNENGDTLILKINDEEGTYQVAEMNEKSMKLVEKVNLDSVEVDVTYTFEKQ